MAAAGLRARGREAHRGALVYWMPLPGSSRAQCSWHRSFPVTAAGQLRNGLLVQASPDSLLSLPVGVGTAGDHKILWASGAVNTASWGDAPHALCRQCSRSIEVQACTGDEVHTRVAVAQYLDDVVIQRVLHTGVQVEVVRRVIAPEEIDSCVAGGPEVARPA